MFIHWFFVEMLKKETKKTSGEIKRGKISLKKQTKFSLRKLSVHCKIVKICQKNSFKNPNFCSFR